MGYQDRSDIDSILQKIEEIKYFVGFGTDKELATVEALDSLSNELMLNYYPKSETYSKDRIGISLHSSHIDIR